MRPRFLGPATTIDRTQTLAGVPILRIRAFLRRYRDTSWPADIVEKAFPGLGQKILEALVEEGYVVPTSDLAIFKVTIEGESLVNLTAYRPVSRGARA